MPKPKKMCSCLSCRTMIDYDQKYCDKHRNHHDTIYNRIRNQNERTYIQFYKSKPWRQVREQIFIRDHYTCQACLKNNKLTRAQLVDHIIPTKVNWNKRLDESNLQALCESCHQIKTKNENREKQ